VRADHVVGLVVRGKGDALDVNFQLLAGRLDRQGDRAAGLDALLRRVDHAGLDVEHLVAADEDLAPVRRGDAAQVEGILEAGEMPLVPEDLEARGTGGVLGARGGQQGGHGQGDKGTTGTDRFHAGSPSPRK
jgi:hypothetical protein